MNDCAPKNEHSVSSIPILYVDDDNFNLEAFKLSFEDEFNILTAPDGMRGLELLEQNDIGLVLSDERMPHMSGVQFLQQVAERWPDTVRIIISAFSDPDTLLKAINLGNVHEYIVKPWNNDQLKATLHSSLNMVANRRELRSKASITEVYQQDLRAQTNPDDLVAKSSMFLEVIDLAKHVAATDAPVLIVGETGTGKEVIARIIHENSGRSGPFIRTNCASISESLLHSELFGHEKGAFTGANQLRRGKFELANLGSILLDEIGDITPATQLSMLRVLQEREVERVGASKTISLDVRIIAATNRNLDDMVVSGMFRKDLFYRLNVIRIHVPPLRNRRDDIVPLFYHFSNKFIQKYRLLDIDADQELLDCLCDYDWPGNVRELENMVQRAVITSKGGHITLSDFSFDLRRPPGRKIAPDNKTSRDVVITERNRIESDQREKLRRALRNVDGNCTKAAQLLEIPRTTFMYRAKKLGLI